MPRTGGVFSLLSGSKGTPNTTIQSAPYNAQLDDFAQDANLARPITAGGTGATNVSAARVNLGLVPGTDVQAYSAALKSIADLTTVADRMIYTTAADAYATTVLTPFARTILDDVDAATARATLGLGTLSTLNAVNNSNWSGTALAVANGGTGAATAADARTNLGLGNVNNTSDANKPVSTAQQAALDALSALINDPFALQPVGALIALRHGITQIPEPPKDKAYRYILLTAGQAGSGSYNEGVLTSEVVSGSQPVVSAYATINLTGSVLTGQTVRLINTERRFLRAGSPGTLQDSAFASHSNSYNDPGHKHTLIADGASGLASIPRIDNQGISNQKFFNDATSVATTGITINANGDTETRPRNIGVDYYMRIK